MWLIYYAIHKWQVKFLLTLLALALLYQPTRTFDLWPTCPHHSHRQAFQQICRDPFSEERCKLWGTAMTETGSENRRWWLGCVLLRWFRFITRGLIWPATSCLMMHCVWRVRRSGTEELIFFLTTLLQISNFLLLCWMPRINTEFFIHFSFCSFIMFGLCKRQLDLL